jgi:hypothetical protein
MLKNSVTIQKSMRANLDSYLEQTYYGVPLEHRQRFEVRQAYLIGALTVLCLVEKACAEQPKTEACAYLKTLLDETQTMAQDLIKEHLHRTQGN